jgi:hypothetical protein
MIVPMYSSGTTTSTDITGSSRTGLALLHIDQGISGENSAFHRFLDSLFDRFHEFLRNRSANGVVLKLEALTRLLRNETDLDVSVLTASTRLTDVFAFSFGGLADGLAIRNLRLANVRLNVELAHHAIDDDFEVQFAHALDDRLTAVVIGRNPERRIFLRQLVQRDAHLFLVGLGLRLHGDGDNRLRELNGFKNDRVFFRANGVSGRHVLHAHAGADITSEDFADLFAFVGVHAQQTSNTLTL